MKVIEEKNITRPSPDALERGEFNIGHHLFLEVAACQYQTISCKLPNGKFVTFAFVPGAGGDIECVDIHSTVGQPFKYKPTDKDTHYTQHAVGFSRKGDTFDTRKVGRPTGLMTLLLHPSYHQTKEG